MAKAALLDFSSVFSLVYILERWRNLDGTAPKGPKNSESHIAISYHIDEYHTVAWVENGVKVNVSLQPASTHASNDPTILNYEQQFRNRDSFVYNKYEEEDRENPKDVRFFETPVMVRSNTIVGDRFHANGMVVARIVKGKFK